MKRTGARAAVRRRAAALLAALAALPAAAGSAVPAAPAAPAAAGGAVPVAAAGAASPPRLERHVVERHLSAMGTELTVVLEAPDRAAALAASEAAVRAVEAAEARLSTWRDDSELARLNAAPVGEPVALSRELAADLAAAADCWRRTGGSFDPGVGALVAAWGLRDGGRLPGGGELAAAVAATGVRHLDLRHLDLRHPDPRHPDPRHSDPRHPDPRHLELQAAAASAVRLHPGLRVEEGGFGKGAGLAAAAAALEPLLAATGAARGAVPAAMADTAAADDGSGSAGVGNTGVGITGVGITRAMVDLGGQVVLLGRPAPGAGWTVSVADPRDRGRELLTLSVDGGSLATSGNSERGIEVDGRRYGHLLDPRTGRPVPDFGSLTVWSADPLAADCLSTGLYVQGPERALRWAAGQPGVEVLSVEVLSVGTSGEGGLRVRATAGLAGRAVPRLPGLVVETVWADAAPPDTASPDAAPQPTESQRTAGGRTGRRPHEPRAGVVMPWEGRPAARSKPAPPESGTGFRGEYR